MTQAAGGVFSVEFFDPDGVRELLRSATEGHDLRSAGIVHAIGRWLKAAATLPPGVAPQCLTCSCEMAGQVPLAFGAISPFAAAGFGASISGICAECALLHPALVAAAVEAWRATWPGLRLIDGGHA
jgi:hypothetical protein